MMKSMVGELPCQTHQKFESLKINSRDDKIRFEFDELKKEKEKEAEIVRIYFLAHGNLAHQLLRLWLHCPNSSSE